MTVRVLSYNIHGAKGCDGRRDFARIGRFLREQNIDIALIQELNTLRADRGADEHIAELRGGRFSHFVAAPTLQGTRGWHGNGILSRFPIARHNIIDITWRGREPRNIVEAFVTTPGGPLHVVNTHKGLGYFERGRQIAKLNEVLATKSEVPLIVGGDINEWQIFSAGLRKLNRDLRPLGTGPTFPTVWPLFHLDRMWCRPKGLVAGWRVLKTAETRLFSDHYPLLAEVSL
jgi:endonuclease/exonuclease/phosphatase family metal-dependent hydrolase